MSVKTLQVPGVEMETKVRNPQDPEREAPPTRAKIPPQRGSHAHSTAPPPPPRPEPDVATPTTTPLWPRATAHSLRPALPAAAQTPLPPHPVTSRPRPAQTHLARRPSPGSPSPHQLEPIVDTDALLPCALGTPATWTPLWSFFFRIIVITEDKLQGAGPEGLLAALFPSQPPEGPSRHRTQRPVTSGDWEKSRKDSGRRACALRARWREAGVSRLRAAAVRDFLPVSGGIRGGRACLDELSRELGATTSGVSESSGGVSATRRAGTGERGAPAPSFLHPGPRPCSSSGRRGGGTCRWGQVRVRCAQVGARLRGVPGGGAQVTARR